MNSFNAEELGRVVANAVSSFLRPSGPQRSETSQITPSSVSSTATTTARSTPRSATGTSSHGNTRIAVTSYARPQTQTTLALPMALPSRYQSSTNICTTSSRRRTSGTVGRTKSWSKDVVCIPEKDHVGADTITIPIPRGETRGALAIKGLVGKIRIISTWSPYQVMTEISSIFGKLFLLGEDELLDFEYLMVVKGTRRLKIPSVSSPFVWSGQEVASLAGQGCLYILARTELIEQEEMEQEEEFGETTVQNEDERLVTGGSTEIHVPSPQNDNDIEIIEGISTPQYSKSTVELDLKKSKPHDTMPFDFRSYISLLEDEQLSDDDDDICLQIALQESARNVGQPVRPALQDIQGILKDHCLTVMGSTEDLGRNYVNVRRGHVLNDGIHKINRSTLKPNFPISIKFADDAGNSEGAVDTGGPTREFFRLGINELFKKASVFQGPDRNKVLVHNIQALAQGMYKSYGMFLALSLANGGKACHCLCKSVFRFIVGGDAKPTIDDIPYQQTREILSKVKNSQAEEEFSNHIKNNGVTMFCYQGNVLSATDLDQIFTPIMVPVGNNRRDRQELIMMHWRDYLQETEGGNTGVSLEDILIFATGADEVPPCGFTPDPVVDFWEDRRPRGNSCANTICLPTWPNKDDVSFVEFREFFDDGILNSPGFGRP